ncbi:hypothetical protein ACN6MY_10930 [Peribacillus sp. B-H-3]|uniref:hypothetical protein n=1 Tax=Peribacillus sp. B-H-3 TaxID=3400420 RepID=UPI003B024F9A
MKKFFISFMIVVLAFTLCAKSSFAYSERNYKDKKGTYTVVTYSSSDLKAKIKRTKHSINYYSSHTSTLMELIADSIISFKAPVTGFFLGFTHIYAHDVMVSDLKKKKSDYAKLLKVANSGKHGVKVKRYYLRTYQTGLGMVEDYYGKQIVYKY